MKKGITPVVAVVLLLIIAVAVVGMGYTFVFGFFEAISSKTASVSGVSSCVTGAGYFLGAFDADGHVIIKITNTGKSDITRDDVIVTRTKCIPGNIPDNCLAASPDSDDFEPSVGGGFITDLGDWTTGQSIATGGTGFLIEPVIITDSCKEGNVCMYDVMVGGMIFITRAEC